MGKHINEQQVYSRLVGLDMKQEFDANNYPIYIGWAFPGALVSDAKWQIQKLAYDANGNLTSQRWAKRSDEPINNDQFNKTWDDRATYNYVDI